MKAKYALALLVVSLSLSCIPGKAFPYDAETIVNDFANMSLELFIEKHGIVDAFGVTFCIDAYRANMNGKATLLSNNFEDKLNAIEDVKGFLATASKVSKIDGTGKAAVVVEKIIKRANDHLCPTHY